MNKVWCQLMELSIFKSEASIKVIMLVIFWGIRWLYRHLGTSDGSISDQELDEVEDNDTPPVTTIPILRKVERAEPQACPLPQVVEQNPRSSPLQSSVIDDRKVSFGSKRKLFRNALLMHALIQRKDFIA